MTYTFTKTALRAALRQSNTLEDAYRAAGCSRPTFLKYATQLGLDDLVAKRAAAGKRLRGRGHVDLHPVRVQAVVKDARSVSAAAAELGVASATLETYVHREDRAKLNALWSALVERGRANRGAPQMADRNEALLADAETATSYRELGRKYEISYQRAAAIIDTYGRPGLAADVVARGHAHRNDQGREKSPNTVKLIRTIMENARSYAAGRREARVAGVGTAAFDRICEAHGLSPMGIENEREGVARRRALGMRNDEIASLLGIPRSRVNEHVTQLLRMGAIQSQPVGRPASTTR